MPRPQILDPGRNPLATVASGRFPMIPLAALILTGLLVLVTFDSARGDFIFLKDGLMLQGRVNREGTTIADNGQAVWIPKGFYWVEDGARRVAFSPGQVDKVETRDYNPEHDLHQLRVAGAQKPLPPLREVLGASAWDDKWDRTVKVRCQMGKTTPEITLTQHVTSLTPHYAQFDSLGYGYRWSSAYLTKELPPDMVRSLLASHPEFKETPKMEEDAIASKRFRAFHFLTQAGLLDQAEKVLVTIEKDCPTQKEKVATAREGLKKLRAMQLADDLKLAQGAGQHRRVMKGLEEFSEDGTPEKTKGEIIQLKEKYTKSTESFKHARRLLEELPKAITETELRNLFTAAAESIDKELNYDNLGRLESFLSLALQAERQKKQGAKVDNTPSELMALAVSGWLLGNVSSETKVEFALKLWKARDLAMKYQQSNNQGNRQQMLRNYLAQKDALAVDEMAQLIVQLPPPEPEEKIVDRPFKTETKGAGRSKALTYHIQLPPEYSHGRPYPVLLALHNGGGGIDTARDMLEQWRDAAAQNGYILVAPEWGQGLTASYTYTAEEHAIVLDLLRDLRRRFNVDSDRVFLHGFGEGGTMAYDIGLSHPHLFAGVLPMAGQPSLFPRRYWRNGQYLPFYVVSGNHSGQSHIDNRRQFEDWIPQGYPAILVERRGRGLEFFTGEVPLMFEWMKHKKRAMPVSEVGAQGREFQTMRATDNHFYWISTDSINPANLNDGQKWNPATLSATFWGYINRENNQIIARSSGLRQMSIWLGRDSKGYGMVDFNAAVTVVINGQTKMSGKVTPSMETLLEDLHQRGDRQRVFLAKLDFNRL